MITKFKHLFALFIVITAAISCSEDTTPVVEEDPTHEAMGDWEGTFSGGDNGTWKMIVDKDGLFEGEVYSNNGQSYHPLSGSIDENGAMTAEIDINGTILDFSGQQSGTQASGTWGNASINITGTWTGAKL